MGTFLHWINIISHIKDKGWLLNLGTKTATVLEVALYVDFGK